MYWRTLDRSDHRPEDIGPTINSSGEKRPLLLLRRQERFFVRPSLAKRRQSRGVARKTRPCEVRMWKTKPLGYRFACI